jgi:hypothetical protein
MEDAVCQSFVGPDDIFDGVCVGAVEYTGFSKCAENFCVEAGEDFEPGLIGSEGVESDRLRGEWAADRAESVFAKNCVPHVALVADPFPNEVLLIELGKGTRIEGRGSVLDLNKLVAAASSGRFPERVVKHLPYELTAVVLGYALESLGLLLGEELAVIVGVAAVDTPEDEIFRQCLVIFIVDSKVLTALRAFTAQVAIRLQWHRYTELRLVPAAAEELNTVWEPEVSAGGPESTHSTIVPAGTDEPAVAGLDADGRRPHVQGPMSVILGGVTRTGTAPTVVHWTEQPASIMLSRYRMQVARTVH